MNKYISLAAGISLILAAYFNSSVLPQAVFGFVPLVDSSSLIQNAITAAGYIFGGWFTYNGIRQMYKS
jgi:arginine exporter protein ArgO